MGERQGRVSTSPPDYPSAPLLAVSGNWELSRVFRKGHVELTIDHAVTSPYWCVTFYSQTDLGSNPGSRLPG